MAQHRLYAVFYTRDTIDIGTPDGGGLWTLKRNGKQARKLAQLVRGLCLSMPLPDTSSWDAPTFRACADRVECDYRPK